MPAGVKKILIREVVCFPLVTTASNSKLDEQVDLTTRRSDSLRGMDCVCGNGYWVYI